MSYYDSAITCLTALKDFRDEINDYLPDTAGGDNYEYPWDLNDARYVYKTMSSLHDRILDTEMKDHNAFELHNIAREYTECLKKEDISGCQKVLNKAMKEYALLFQAYKWFRDMKKGD